MSVITIKIYLLQFSLVVDLLKNSRNINLNIFDGFFLKSQISLEWTNGEMLKMWKYDNFTDSQVKLPELFRKSTNYTQ